MSDASSPLAPQGQVLIYTDGGSQLRVRLDGNTVWLTQKLMAELYGVSVPNVNQHLKAICDEGELSQDRTIKQYLIVQREGSRDVSRNVDHKLAQQPSRELRRTASHNNTSRCPSAKLGNGVARFMSPAAM